jgi:anti-sigma regulatory factor (Ser/Thr protein kinase)
MPDTPAPTAKARLSLDSRLTDLALVFPWVDEIAIEYGLSSDTVFAVNLCLEEALSNIIRHGYKEDPGHPLTVDVSVDDHSTLLFAIEDHAPHFVPPDVAESQAVAPPMTIEELPFGGQGLRLMRKFSASLVWQQTPGGNLLTIGFSLASPSGSAL